MDFERWMALNDLEADIRHQPNGRVSFKIRNFELSSTDDSAEVVGTARRADDDSSENDVLRRAKGAFVAAVRGKAAVIDDSKTGKRTIVIPVTLKVD